MQGVYFQQRLIEHKVNSRTNKSIQSIVSQAFFRNYCFFTNYNYSPRCISFQVHSNLLKIHQLWIYCIIAMLVQTRAYEISLQGWDIDYFQQCSDCSQDVWTLDKKQYYCPTDHKYFLISQPKNFYIRKQGKKIEPSSIQEVNQSINPSNAEEETKGVQTYIRKAGGEKEQQSVYIQKGLQKAGSQETKEIVVEEVKESSSQLSVKVEQQENGEYINSLTKEESDLLKLQNQENSHEADQMQPSQFLNKPKQSQLSEQSQTGQPQVPNKSQPQSQATVQKKINQATQVEEEVKSDVDLTAQLEEKRKEIQLMLLSKLQANIRTFGQTINLQTLGKLVEIFDKVNNN